VPQTWFTRLWLGGLVCTCLAATAIGATVPILSGSDLTGVAEWNGTFSVKNADVAISTYGEPVWKAPTLGGQWISYTLSGPGQNPVVNVPLDGSGFILGGPSARFFYQFTLPSAAVSGQVSLWADDTAAVLLDGAVILALTPNPVRAIWCTEGAAGCQPANAGVVDLSGLSAGTHTLSIEAYQLWGNTFGVLYEGAVVIVDVPEPSTVLLLMSGLLMLAWRGACAVTHG
jgi:hypothetical protein